MVDKIEEVKKLVNGVVDKYKVFEGEFDSVTYYWGGDYEGKTFEKKSGKIITRVSENEIVGRLRWFLRTVLARFSPYVSDLNSYEEVEKCIYFLGATSDEALKEASLKSDYIFRAEVIDYAREIRDRDLIEDLSRVKLSLMGKGKNVNQFLPIEGVKFKLEAYRLKEGSSVEERHGKECIQLDKRDFLVIGGTLLTLAYLGIGKATSRGFGRFYPVKNTKLWIAENIRDKIMKLIDDVQKGEVQRAFRDFYTNIGFNPSDPSSYKKWTDSSIPLAPLPDGDNEDCIKVVNVNLSSEKDNKLLNIMKCINNSTLKIYYKNRLHNESVGIHTWVFGFPRAHISGKGIETGYYYKDDKNVNNALRRISLVIISPVKKQTDDYDIAILPFLSLKDLEDKVKDLYHKEEYRVNYPPWIAKEISKIIKEKLEKEGKKPPKPPTISLVAKVKVNDILESSKQISIQFEDEYENEKKVNEIYKEVYDKFKKWYQSGEREQLRERVKNKIQISNLTSDPRFRHLVFGKSEEIIKAYINYLPGHIKNLCGTKRQSYGEQKGKQQRRSR